MTRKHLIFKAFHPSKIANIEKRQRGLPRVARGNGMRPLAGARVGIAANEASGIGPLVLTFRRLVFGEECQKRNRFVSSLHLGR